MRSYSVLWLLTVGACAAPVVVPVSSRNAPARPSVAAPTVATCQLALEVSGVEFAPAECTVYAFLPGEPCGPNRGCPLEYSIRLKDPAPGHPREVGLYKFRDLRDGTVVVQALSGRKEFSGVIVAKDGISRNLQQGDVSFQATGVPDQVKVTFDLFFPADIRIRGSGVLPVKHVAGA